MMIDGVLYLKVADGKVERLGEKLNRKAKL